MSEVELVKRLQGLGIEREARETIERLVKEVERLNLSLAACGVGAMANTETSKQQRINKDNPYWCASVGDVYAAVDREMEHRTRAEAAEGKVAALQGIVRRFLASPHIADVDPSDKDEEDHQLERDARKALEASR